MEKERSMRKGNLVAATVLVLAGLACSFSIGGGATPAENDALFQDDFSDTGSGWDHSTTDTGSSDYQDGGYHISVGPEYSSVWANPGKSFTDVSVEVDGHKLSGVDDNEFGVLCRYQDVDNFYGASISSDGYYGFFKLDNGDFGYLGTDKMVKSDAIHLGSESNHIRLDCVGSTLTLYINGEMVSSTSDGSFNSGDVGLYAGTFATANVDVLFDDFVVRQP
jgi:hypothetical protein